MPFNIASTLLALFFTLFTNEASSQQLLTKNNTQLLTDRCFSLAMLDLDLSNDYRNGVSISELKNRYLKPNLQAEVSEYVEQSINLITEIADLNPIDYEIESYLNCSKKSNLKVNAAVAEKCLIQNGMLTTILKLKKSGNSLEQLHAWFKRVHPQFTESQLEVVMIYANYIYNHKSEHESYEFMADRFRDCSTQ